MIKVTDELKTSKTRVWNKFKDNNDAYNFASYSVSQKCVSCPSPLFNDITASFRMYTYWLN